MFCFLNIQDAVEEPLLAGNRVPIQMSKWATSAYLHSPDDTIFGSPDNRDHHLLFYLFIYKIFSFHSWVCLYQYYCVWYMFTIVTHLPPSSFSNIPGYKSQSNVSQNNYRSGFCIDGSYNSYISYVRLFRLHSEDSETKLSSVRK